LGHYWGRYDLELWSSELQTDVNCKVLCKKSEHCLQELKEEREHSGTLKAYVEQILVDVMVTNPQLLEKN
jgi:hypothetical protein